MRKSFERLFDRRPALIAMVHTGPSPGVPGFVCVESAIERAVAETELYVELGVDGILLENMRDFPCVHEREQGPEIAAFMTRIARAVKRHAEDLPVGVQVLFQANRTALAVALSADCDFIRAEGWTYAHVSDKGIAEASAGSVVRYRSQIGADDIAIFADIRKKHASHALTADLDIATIAATMHLHAADALIVTGMSTGIAPEAADLLSVRSASGLPLIIGSGVSVETLDEIGPLADAFIVGSALKEGRKWDAPVDESNVRAVVEAVACLRGAGTFAETSGGRQDTQSD